MRCKRVWASEHLEQLPSGNAFHWQRLLILGLKKTFGNGDGEILGGIGQGNVFAPSQCADCER